MRLLRLEKKETDVVLGKHRVLLIRGQALILFHQLTHNLSLQWCTKLELHILTVLLSFYPGVCPMDALWKNQKKSAVQDALYRLRGKFQELGLELVTYSNKGCVALAEGDGKGVAATLHPFSPFLIAMQHKETQTLVAYLLLSGPGGFSLQTVHRYAPLDGAFLQALLDASPQICPSATLLACYQRVHRDEHSLRLATQELSEHWERSIQPIRPIIWSLRRALQKVDQRLTIRTAFHYGYELCLESAGVDKSA